MKSSDPRLDPARPLASDHDLHEVLSLLLRAANQRQFWLIFLDDSHRVTGPLMPMADYPPRPGDPSEVEGRDEDPIIEVLWDHIGRIAQMAGASSLVLVWERSGPAKFSEIDLSWARACADVSAQNGPKIRAQFVLHSSGLRQIAIDDLL